MACATLASWPRGGEPVQSDAGLARFRVLGGGSLSRHVDDVSLIARCLRRDEEAWQTLTDRYQNLVYSTALDTGLDRESCADVYQQVWLELYRSLHRLQDPRALPRWLIVTTRRLSYRLASAQNRMVGEVERDLVDPTPRADESITALEGRQRLADALPRLERRCRELFEMLFLGEKKVAYRTIASRLGIAVGSIGSLRARCLDQLRMLVEESP